MSKLKIKGKDLIKMGFPQGRVIGIALYQMQNHYPKKKKTFIKNQLQEVLKNPGGFVNDNIMGVIAQELIAPDKNYELREHEVPYKIYGEEYIEKGAIEQMNIASKLPVTIKGALMADAHEGYGLPIGGVLATKNAIIPYGVGMDIGCRMCLSVYDIPVGKLKGEQGKYKKILVENTRFGFNETFDRPYKDEVFEREEFTNIEILRKLKNLAYKQMGTSGSGNHFVEFGQVEITDNENEFNLPKGIYFGVLSHSGSRGMGAKIATYYSNLAKEITPLPKNARQLAWFDLDSNEGQEYWAAMTLAGDYASACHADIHRRLSKALGKKPLAVVENHHNFAWKEKLEDGTEAIVHRKGATPANKGDLGIIPGSMATHAFIVRGKGNRESINSASHGAGRRFSRNAAKQSFTGSDMKKVLKNAGIELIGGGLDEIPMAYKDIYTVMDLQKDLVDVIGTFMPKIVRMS